MWWAGGWVVGCFLEILTKILHGEEVTEYRGDKHGVVIS